jgi:hypothetical protein
MGSEDVKVSHSSLLAAMSAYWPEDQCKYALPFLVVR